MRESALTFWNWRRGPAGPATVGTSAVAMSADLAPIELYTADARIVGWIAAGGRRVTDLLNDRGELRLWRPSPGPLENGTHVELDGHSAVPDDADGPDASGEWQSLAADRVIIAMPPEWRASRQLRLHRRLRRAAMVAGPFNITGNLHLPPGAEVGMHVLTRGPRWIPLTDAYILHTGNPPFEHVVSVVIINTSHVGQIVPLMTLA
jgi:hypothetical protein